MNVFSRLFEPKLTDSARFERLEAKVRSLEDEFATLQRRIKAMELDWEQTYDKMSHLMARITKRRAALAAEQAQAETPAAPETHFGRPAGDGPPAVVGTHDRLQEMRRRNGLLPR